MSIPELLRDLFNYQKTSEEVEERRQVVARALIDDQRQRVRWLESYIRYAPTEEERAAAKQKLEAEKTALKRLETGEEGDFLDALGL